MNHLSIFIAKTERFQNKSDKGVGGGIKCVSITLITVAERWEHKAALFLQPLKVKTYLAVVVISLLFGLHPEFRALKQPRVDRTRLCVSGGSGEVGGGLDQTVFNQHKPPSAEEKWPKIAEIHLVEAATGLSAAAVVSRCCDKPLARVFTHTQTLTHVV